MNKHFLVADVAENKAYDVRVLEIMLYLILNTDKVFLFFQSKSCCTVLCRLMVTEIHMSLLHRAALFLVAKPNSDLGKLTF